MSIHSQVIARCDDEDDICPTALVVPNTESQPFQFLTQRGWSVIQDTGAPWTPATYCPDHKETK